MQPALSVGFSESPKDVKRRAAHGYRFGENPMPSLPPPDETLKLISFSVPENNEIYRPVVMTSLGPHFDGACLVHACPSDPITTFAGVRKRIAADNGKPDKTLLSMLKPFVYSWCVENLTPLSADTDTSHSTWVDHTPYPAYRKDELRVKNSKITDQFDPKHKKCKCFVKDEPYTELKHCRNIFSRTDEHKCKVGPITQLISDEVFKLPEFIKKIPHKDRPKYIDDLINIVGARVLCTDYSSFESSFTAEVQLHCEFVLYEYMTQYLPERDDYLRHMRGQIEKNICDFKHFSISLEAKRMSGEMNTSLGNGFTNLMLMYFVCHLKGISKEDIRMVVEGDDGLTAIVGPTLPTTEDFAKLGFTVKLEVKDSIHTASFCGVIYHPDDCINVTDPLPELMTFGWSTRRYANSGHTIRMQLLRSKALSMIYQYPGCPILQSLAWYGLRVTSRYKASTTSWSNSYEKEMIDKAIASVPERRDIGLATRTLVSELYKIPITMQLAIEEYLDNKRDLKPIRLPCLSELIPDVWKDYYEKYTHMLPLGNRYNDYPALYYPRPSHESLMEYLLDETKIYEPKKRSSGRCGGLALVDGLNLPVSESTRR